MNLAEPVRGSMIRRRFITKLAKLAKLAKNTKLANLLINISSGHHAGCWVKAPKSAQATQSATGLESAMSNVNLKRSSSLG